VTISYSDDAEAAWLRKGNRAYYGYKIHAATDTRDGFVLGGHATPANRSDTEEFVAVLDEVDAKVGESIFADKGYNSLLNRYVLQVRGLADGIMHKAARNRELTPVALRRFAFPQGFSPAFDQIVGPGSFLAEPDTVPSAAGDPSGGFH